jgi:hypothetical protein
MIACPFSKIEEKKISDKQGKGKGRVTKTKESLSYLIKENL